MKASIYGEDEVVTGVTVADNEGVEHDIQIEHDGEIHAHQQNGYPDKAAKRTPEGNEHVEQARRFAQYYVAVERGYDTIPAMIDPGRLNAVREAIESISTDECMALFGDLRQQMASHHGDAERVVEIPDAATSPDMVLYRKDVYLGLDPAETDLADQASSLAAQHGLDISDPPVYEQSIAELSPGARDTWGEFGDALGELLGDSDADVAEGVYIDAVSDLYMAYPDSRGREHVTDVRQPLDREPDARFELGPIDPRSPEHFHEYLAFNLACQIRDCFVRMGVQPPAEFRVLGYGRYEAAERYNTVDFYPTFHDPENPKLLE